MPRRQRAGRRNSSTSVANSRSARAEDVCVWCEPLCACVDDDVGRCGVSMPVRICVFGAQVHGVHDEVLGELVGRPHRAQRDCRRLAGAGLFACRCCAIVHRRVPARVQPKEKEPKDAKHKGAPKKGAHLAAVTLCLPCVGACVHVVMRMTLCSRVERVCACANAAATVSKKSSTWALRVEEPEWS